MGVRVPPGAPITQGRSESGTLTDPNQWTGSSMVEQRPVKAPDAGSNPVQFANRVQRWAPRR